MTSHDIPLFEFDPSPEAVINQERQRVSEFGARKAELEAQRGKLAAG